jgi:hydroxymethylbilane synthase
MSVVIATRGSMLALWQSNHIKSLIENEHNAEVNLEIFKTQGDKILDVPLAKIGGKGLFTKELEEAMLAGDAQLAVHSLKDVPTFFPEGLKLSAITIREDSRDAMLSQNYDSIDALPEGAVVGTTSLRRKMQLLHYRSDLVIKDLRGNVDTRIRKLKDGEYDAIILASAGINRLGISDSVNYMVPIDKDIMVPAMGQAALGIETPDNEADATRVAFLDDRATNIETTIERDFVDALQGGCQVPIGINAELEGDSILVRAIIGMPDGTEMLKERETISVDEYEEYGAKLAQRFIDQGAKELLARAEEVAFA